jgi:hypothetical protein
MPSLMLRGLPADLVARVKSYAHALGLSLPAAAARLLVDGLGRHEARQAAGRATAESRTPEERTAHARAAAEARWRQD